MELTRLGEAWIRDVDDLCILKLDVITNGGPGLFGRDTTTRTWTISGSLLQHSINFGSFGTEKVAEQSMDDFVRKLGFARVNYSTAVHPDRVHYLHLFEEEPDAWAVQIRMRYKDWDQSLMLTDAAPYSDARKALSKVAERIGAGTKPPSPSAGAEAKSTLAADQTS